MNILKKQVKYCLYDEEMQEDKLLGKKTQKDKRNEKIKLIEKESLKYENNLKYFEYQEKYKKVSSNILNYLKMPKSD